MGLRYITATVLFVIHMNAVFGVDLPMLPGNKLLLGIHRELENAKVLDCSKVEESILTNEFTTSTVSSPGKVLNAHFSQHPFTSFTKKAVSWCDDTPISRYTFAAMVYNSRTTYALQLDTGSQGEKAYWIPRGGTIDIPKNPAALGLPKYVFTHDLNHHSVLTVTPMDNDMLRLRHIEDGNEGPGFNALNAAQKGGPVTYALQFKDYGYIHNDDGQLIRHNTAYAYMAYSGDKWTMHVQHQTCAPNPIYYYYDSNNKLERLTNEYNSNTHDAVPSIVSYSIPSGSASTLLATDYALYAATPRMSSDVHDSGNLENLVTGSVHASAPRQPACSLQAPKN